MQIVVNQLLTRYEIEGNGKTVLLLHGWGDTLDGLASLRNYLAKQYTVIALDLPGFGHSQPPAVVWDLDNYAAFVRDFLKKLDVHELYGLVGHSNGGALAIRAVALKTLAPHKLVLLAAAGIRTTHGGRRMLLKIIAKVGNVATIWMPERYRRALRKSLYGVSGSDMLVVPHLQETFKVTVRQDVQADALTLTIPTLLIYGENDQAVPLEDGQTYHRLIKNSVLKALPTGHFVHLDQPEVTAKLVEEFLK